MTYPCTRAMVSDVTTITPDTTVEQALAIFKEKSIRNVPVVESDGTFIGLFGLKEVLINLLPKAAIIEDGLQSLSFVQGAAPGIAKRLRKLHSLQVAELMNKKPHSVECETSTIEALRVMAFHGSPVVVKEKGSNKFKGIISRKTLLDDMYGLLEEIEKEEQKNN
jgi:predicted transcriptional regulator